MRRFLVMGCLLAGLASAGCERKTDNAAANAPATPAAAVNTPAAAVRPAPPPLPAVSPEACSVIAAYAKAELNGDFGLPLMSRVAPAAKEPGISAAELAKAFPELKAAQAAALSGQLTESIRQGSEVLCDWKAAGLAPRTLLPDGHEYIRFRAAVDGDIAVLDSFTDAGEMVTAGGRCLYRRSGEGWTRAKCVLTHLS